MLSRLAQSLLRSGQQPCSQAGVRGLSGLAFQKVERVAWDNQGDAEQQQKDIMGRAEPLILTGSIESWPVRKYNLDSMRKEFGDIVVSNKQLLAQRHCSYAVWPVCLHAEQLLVYNKHSIMKPEWPLCYWQSGLCLTDRCWGRCLLSSVDGAVTTVTCSSPTSSRYSEHACLGHSCIRHRLDYVWDGCSCASQIQSGYVQQ